MSIKNLYNEKALNKITEISKDIKVAMFATNIGNKPLSIIPMYTKKVDEQGCIWFLSKNTSDHNKNIRKDNNVQLVYSDPKSMTYLSVYGVASITRDSEIIDSLYSKLDDNWFDSKDDSSITAIKVAPLEAYYWDTKSNSYIEILKMTINAYVDADMDLGEKGKLTI